MRKAKLIAAAVVGGGPNPNLPDELKTNWQPALAAAGSTRASIGVIGDSITMGHGSTNWDTTAFVAVLRTLMQSRYGNGGEGFLSLLHTDYTGGSDPGPGARWTYNGTWEMEIYNDSRAGIGAIAGRKYCVTSPIGKYVEITALCDRAQVMTGHNHSGGGSLSVTIGGGAPTVYDLYGVPASGMHWGQLIDVTAASLASQAIRCTVADNPGGANDYGWLEGVRPLTETKGVVVDRFGKGWMRASWLGVVAEATATDPYYEALKSCVDVLGNKLFIIALGINDYISQTALATFETTLGVIAARCRVAVASGAAADCIILAMPQPNTALTIPYSSYVASMGTVATANGCKLLDMRDKFGAAYKAAWMTDDNHPNDLGHAAIANYIYDTIHL